MGAPHVYVALSQFCQNDETPRRILQDAGFMVTENGSGRRPRPDELIESARDCSGIIAGVEHYDAETLGALPELRCISRCGAGIDSIDLEAAARLNIAVCSTPELVAEPVAQLTLAMILALARRLPESNAASWRRHTGFLLSEWTIGLVGFGRIGQAVERYLQPFSPRICVASPRLKEADAPPGVEVVDLNGLVAQSDLISIHAARRTADRPLIAAAEIARMKPGARIVNTARGYLLDEAALLEALNSGRLSGAALDVYSEEPYAGPLLNHPKVLCTPHIGTLTRASRREMELRAVENLIGSLR